MKTGTRERSVFESPRRTTTIRLTLATTVLLGLLAGGVHAITLYWQGGSGNWGVSTKWNTVSGGTGSPGVPNTVDDVASVGGSWAAPIDAKLADAAGADASFTIGALGFRMRNGTTHARNVPNVTGGSGTLTFDVSSGSALVDGTGLNAAGAPKQVSVGVVLNDDLNIANSTTEATGAGGTLTFSKAVTSGAAGTRNVTILAVTSGTGAPVILQGVNTYTGTTTVQASGTANRQGWLQLASTGELRLRLQNGNAGDRIVGSSGAYVGKVALDGVLRLDGSALTVGQGAWPLVDVANLEETFGATFGLAFVGGPAFSHAGGGVYRSGKWSFDTATGLLSLSSPGTVVMVR